MYLINERKITVNSSLSTKKKIINNAMHRNEGWQTPLVARTSPTPCKIQEQASFKKNQVATINNYSRTIAICENSNTKNIFQVQFQYISSTYEPYFSLVFLLKHFTLSCNSISLYHIQSINLRRSRV